ncbi:Glycosyltransferase family 4 protein OS=Stutzerimonas stutzeri OX=316 GN=N7335_02755 PE=4 SV=1 [Stutzerimonas stutzeri]
MSKALILLAVLASWALTAGLRIYAEHCQLLDVPNARSSHRIATPRGGGLAIVLVVLVGIAVLLAFGAVSREFAWALIGGGAVVALLGFVDDHGHIAAGWRLLGHFTAAIWVVVWLGGLPAIDLFGLSLDLGLMGFVFAVVGLVWGLNLFNFMDGIDGIAGAEALTLSLLASLCYALAGDLVNASVEWLVAAATLGFLFWNFPRARIFMGDVGSGFLGLVLGALALHAAWQVPVLLWCWLILAGVFVVDATFTMLRRLQRGEAIHQAHRSHGYQIASRRCGRHVPITLGVVALNLGWLGPIAALVAVGRLEGAAGLIVAYLPLLALVIWLGAGTSERTG